MKTRNLKAFLQRGDENYEFKENARDHHVSQQTYLRHTCNSNMFSPYHSINLHLHCPFLQVHQGRWASRAMSEQKVQRVLRQMWPAWQLWAAWNRFCLDCCSFLIVSYTFILFILDFFPVLLAYFDSSSSRLFLRFSIDHHKPHLSMGVFRFWCLWASSDRENPKGFKRNHWFWSSSCPCN